MDAAQQDNLRENTVPPTSQGNNQQNTASPAQIVPMPMRDPQASSEGAQHKMKDAVNEFTERATDIAIKAKDTAQRTYQRARRQTVEGYSMTVARAEDLGRHTREWVRNTKEERPLQLLAMIAGAALVSGIAIRIWRSRAS